MTVSRRRLVQVLSAVAAGVPAVAQAPPDAVPPSADAELQSARQYAQAVASTVRRVQLPMSVEPAVRFVPRS